MHDILAELARADAARTDLLALLVISHLAALVGGMVLFVIVAEWRARQRSRRLGRRVIAITGRPRVVPQWMRS